MPKSNVSVSITINTISGGKYDIELGEAAADDIQTLNQTIVSAFGTVQATKDFLITDAAGVTYHFNVDNVECVRVKVE